MIEELIRKIDTRKIIDTLGNISIQIPSMQQDIFNTFDSPRLSVVQLDYIGEEYEIAKFYITMNSNVEIALDSSYKFNVLNFCLDNDGDTIYAYDSQGREVLDYYINRDALSGYNNSTYMRKSTGDIYIPSFRAMTGEYEPIRREWDQTEKLLCYSEKLDGRMCFYITVNIELDYQIKEDIFVSEVD